MTFDRYSGMASAVGIILILMIVTWLDLWGPIDLTKLEHWQTLLTGILAIFAACIAYAGTTSTARFYREKDRSELNRKKLGLYLRFKFGVRRMVIEAKRHRTLMNHPYHGGNMRYDIRVDDLRFGGFEEFDEAWTNLNLLPQTVSSNLDQIRDVLRKDRIFLDGVKVEIIKDVTFVYTAHPLYQCASDNEYLELAGIAVVDELDREISRLSS